jgi:ankyrin repeat protein
MSDQQPASMSAEQVFDRARQGDADMLQRLLEKGLPANLRNHKGDTLLMLASYHGHLDAVRVLLEHGADPSIANDNGQLPVAGAAFKGNLEMVRLLVEQGIDPDAAAGDAYRLDDGGHVQPRRHRRLPAGKRRRSHASRYPRSRRPGLGPGNGRRGYRRPPASAGRLTPGRLSLAPFFQSPRAVP